MKSANWLVLGSAAAAMVALLVLLPPEWIANAERGVAAWRGWFGVARAGGIVAAWFWWDTLVDRIPRLGPGGVAYLRDRRTFWIGALVAIELVVVQNVPGMLWGLAT